VTREKEMAEVFAPRACKGNAERCCGRKPIPYKRDQHWFCARCDAAYRMPDGEQIENWMWIRAEGGFVPRYPDSEAVVLARAAVLAIAQRTEP
jgi:hypothetical protein